jgi:endonuclease/exonuclease/phosphatase (EEP) superfamily protein YafD
MTAVQRGRRLAVALALAWIVAVLALLAVHLALPQRGGPLALTLILEPYLVMSALVLTPVILAGRRVDRVAVVALLLVVSLARYGPTLVSLTGSAPPDARSVRTMSWNLQSDGVAPSAAAALLGSIEADLVGLQELVPATADALATDPGVLARFPHQVFAPQATVLGIGLLSRHPITDQQSWSDPPLIRAIVAPPGDAPISVVVAHPLPARFTMLAGLPVSLDTARRDAAIARVRSVIDEELASGRSVIVLGDFNVTEREPAYADLSRGLRDAHLDAGVGPGFTWRPTRFQHLAFGLLRIDYLLASSEFTTLAASHDCQPRGSDHCIVMATFARPAD